MWLVQITDYRSNEQPPPPRDPTSRVGWPVHLTGGPSVLACAVCGASRSISPTRPITNRPAYPLAAIAKTAFCASQHQDSISHPVRIVAFGLSSARNAPFAINLDWQLNSVEGWLTLTTPASRPCLLLASSPPSQWTRVWSVTAHRPMAHRRAPTPSWRNRLCPIPMTRTKVC